MLPSAAAHDLSAQSAAPYKNRRLHVRVQPAENFLVKRYTRSSPRSEGTMKLILSVAALLFGLSLGTSGQVCRAGSRTTDEPSKGGYSRDVFIERYPFPRLAGKIENDVGGMVPDVLVEVLDKPEWLMRESSGPPDNQRRIIACFAPKGGFAISGLKKGAYELRVSRGSPFNVSHVYVNIKPGAKKRRLQIRLGLGD